MGLFPSDWGCCHTSALLVLLVLNVLVPTSHRKPELAFFRQEGGRKKSIVIMLNLGKNCILNQAFSSMWAIWFWALSFPSQSRVMRRYYQGLSNLITLKFCWVRAEAVVCTAPLDSPWSTSGSAYYGHLTQLPKSVLHRVALLRRKSRKYTR